MRSKETRKDKTWTNPGSKDQPRRDGHEESVVATHSCSVQSEMFNEANAKKIYLARYSPTSRRAGISFPL